MSIKLTFAKFLLCFGTFCTSAAAAATWTVSAPDTISMQGEIDEGDAANFSKLLTNNITKLVVNSNGGDAEEGLNIGKLILKSRVDAVQVTGLCASSCANYIFTAVKRKIIKDGVVGFHGNISAALTEQRDEFIQASKSDGRTDQQIADILSHYQNVAKEESDFFLSLGVSQALFDRTQSTGMGMGDGKTYGMLAPTAATFKKYGILGVEGDQSLEIIATHSSMKKAADLGFPILID